jgi:hypothetical protein
MRSLLNTEVRREREGGEERIRNSRRSPGGAHLWRRLSPEIQEMVRNTALWESANSQT